MLHGQHILFSCIAISTRGIASFAARQQAISQDFMLGGVRECMGVQTKSGSAEPGARDFLFGGVQFRLGVVHPPMGA
jgi:hypothetical protein